jgi:hypothetical protein
MRQWVCLRLCVGVECGGDGGRAAARERAAGAALRSRGADVRVACGADAALGRAHGVCVDVIPVSKMAQRARSNG